MDTQRASPPNELKPWYYQDWFLFPVFIFWPLWAVLILRSPWHNGMVSGAIAWAMLIAGSYIVVTLLQSEGTAFQMTLTLIIPGLVLTVITQALWFQDKRRLRERGQQPEADDGPAAPAGAGQAGDGRRARRRRRPRAGRPSRRR